MTERRSFIRTTALGTAALSMPALAAYPFRLPNPAHMALPKISLAQWSLHRAFEKKELLPEDFAAIARNTYGLEAVEYVNGFYMSEGGRQRYWNQMKQRAEAEGVKSLLLMVDNEGELGDLSDTARRAAVENHYKWVDAAQILGCHSIRVNAFGKGGRALLKGALIDGLGSLATYAAGEGMQVIVENHGLHTSEADFIIGILKEVNMENLGTLPDFGNWCLSAEWGSTRGGSCENSYDPAEGVRAFLPYAKGVSAKSYAFDAKGNETLIDYEGLLRMVWEAGYEGYIGIEYEGEELSEPEGIRATKTLIERVWNQM